MNLTPCLSSPVAVVISIIFIFSSSAVALEDFNVTDDNYMTVDNGNGETVYITRDLMRRLKEESEIWHWRPWLRTKTEMVGNVILEVERVNGNSMRSFPEGVFDDDQLRQGAFIAYVLFGIYSFTLLTIVCNDYFIPCVELICENLKIPQNVAAATFMSVATSCPEFFVNVISTFLTQSDMGIGTIVGSAIFNLLGVGAIGSLAAIAPIAIERYPVTRDVIIYMINVSVLVAIVWDGQIVWYEAMVLGILYVVYFIFMFNSIRVKTVLERLFACCCKRNSRYTISEKVAEDGVTNKAYVNSQMQINNVNVVNDEKAAVEKEIVNEKPKKSVFRFPKEKGIVYKIWWVYTWPIRLILGLTIPSPVSCKRYYLLTFIMCIVWIGVNSYFVSWSMTVLGNTFLIPESVMGMTFLAFGGCLPEACSIFIMSRKGEGGIGVSNALGANSLSILFALGLPWIIRTFTLLAQGADTAVYINSSGIDFVVGSLLAAAVLLWITLCIGKFKLRRCVGVVLLGLYALFITFAILVEMGIIAGFSDFTS
ncbi:sodium/potassium/calcium exchanger 4-like [Danaus plexippus]|uniref:sodium/potassium/calcium exchanger 4-like n=1 Tax=Danaus plexippus TaxID=13037 RepID=UPI002AB2ED89|nr:sodium/potassium/calcium exchanger 4-like [Danaus plexippus]XP_032527849.2 sodium/potassium/calcium exchanger 4-like [Danaus plexippus]